MLRRTTPNVHRIDPDAVREVDPRSAGRATTFIVAFLVSLGSLVAPLPSQTPMDSQAPGDSPAPASPAGGSGDATAAEDPPEWWAANFELLRRGTLAEKGRAVDTLLEDPHPDQLPALRAALGEEDRNLRVRITNGILHAFPNRAADFFLELIDDPSVHRREAAIFGLGALDDPRVVPRLIGLLDGPRATEPTSPEESTAAETRKTLSEAAARSLLNRGRQAANAAFARVTGQNVPHADRLIAMHARTARAIVEELLRTGREGEFRRLLFSRFADAEAARAARVAHRNAHPDDDAARSIVTIGDKLAAWTPRPSLPAPGTLHYTIHIQNLYVGSEKTVAIHVSDQDFGALLYWDYALDRAIRLELPLDKLLLDPGQCAPRLESVDGVAQLRYTLPERTTFEVGIGILNIAYWSGVVSDGREVVLEFDPESGLPRLETVRDANGQVVATILYDGYAEVRPDRFAPRTITVDVTRARIGARTIPMRYAFHFAVADGIWRFDAGESFALGIEGGEHDDDPVTPPLGEIEVRAVASVTDVKWVPRVEVSGGSEGEAKPTPATGEAGSPDTGDSGGKTPNEKTPSEKTPSTAPRGTMEKSSP